MGGAPVNNGQTRIVVTGASGRLGTAVTQLFERQGLDVLPTDLVASDSSSKNFVAADLRDFDEVRNVLSGAHSVVHLGNHPGLGESPPHTVFNENVTINEHLFQCATELGLQHIVFASTIQLFGSKPDRRTVTQPPERPAFPITPATELAPSNLYSLSKQVSEVMLKFYADRCGITATALRLPLLHHCEGHFAISAGSENEHDIFEGFTSLTYDDAAQLMLSVLSSDLSGFNAFTIGVSDRHLDYGLRQLAETFFNEMPPTTSELIDLQEVRALTGWQPSPVAWTRSVEDS